MELNSWPGAIAVALAIISFYGTTYLVIALNVGWRFGYWLASACFGALMVLLSLVWVINVQPDQAVGPQGELPHWVAVAAGTEIGPVTFEEQTFQSVSQYPGGPWVAAEEGDERIDALGSAISPCVTTDPEKLPEAEREACADAQSFWPDEKKIPVLDGAAVAVLPKVTDVRFADDGGVLAQAKVTPVTFDPRVTKDIDGEALGPTFRIVAVLDAGSVGRPSQMSLLIFLLYEAFHLWGLNRAEKRKLSPAVI